MPKSTAELFLDAIIDSADSYSRADAVDKEGKVNFFYNKHAALISAILGVELEATKTLFGDTETKLTPAQTGLLDGLCSLIEKKCSSPSTKNRELLTLWKGNLEQIRNQIKMPKPSPTLFTRATPAASSISAAAAAAAATTSSTHPERKLLAGHHRINKPNAHPERKPLAGHHRTNKK